MAVKTMKYERKLARQARAMPDAPPPPEVTTAMAQQGVDINRGNSNLQQLAPEAREQLAHDAAGLAEKGGLDSIETSTSQRAQETAQAIAKGGDKPVPVKADPKLESWSQGNLEGQPQALVRDQIRDLVRKNPQQKIPGQGALSTRQGESFDDFRTRYLSAIRGAMQELADNPTKKIGRVTHSQGIKLTKGWLKRGTPDDFSVEPSEMEDTAEAPGSVMRLYPNQKGEWELNDVNLEDKAALQPGIYLIRHGMTPWNRELYQKANGGQDAMKQIAGYSKSLDFGRLRAAADKAQAAGHLTDEQIQQTIDAALPKGDDLPFHHLLAAATVASPKKRAEYAPILADRMQQVQQLPEQPRAALMQYIQQTGLAS